MTIAPLSNGSAPQGDGARGTPQSTTTSASTTSKEAAGVPLAVREERLETQIAQFTRAGYRVENRTHLRAVVIREHTRSVRSRLFEAARTFGVVPLLVHSTRAFHRVLITIEDDGAVRLL